MKKKKNKACGLSERKIEPHVTSGITWMLLQDAVSLIEEVHRLVKRAADSDENFRKSRCGRKIFKKLSKIR